ncbi:MAG: PQ-loop repeat-containing protein [Bdellovibrionales bacterium]|nr:PQ-loop repeat-containing protein [Bdellovibrionales bacterium]
MMSFENLLPLSDLLQSAVVFICAVAFVPQWVKLYRTKSSEDISLHSWVLWTLAAFCGWFYSYVHFFAHGTGTPLLVSTTINLIGNIFSIYLAVIYSRQEERISLLRSRS